MTEDTQRPIIATIVLLTISALWLGLIVFSAADIPFHDDYDTILAFLSSFKNAADQPELIKLLLSPHNEHYPLVLRGIAIGLAELGKVNFWLIALVGNAFFILTIWLLARYAGKNHLHPANAVLLVALLGFLPAYGDSALWATVLLSGIPALFFSVVALYLLAEGNGVARFLSVLFIVLAAASQSNGIFLFPVAIFVVAAGGVSKKEIFAWILLSAAALGGFFWKFSIAAGTLGVLKENPEKYADLVSYLLAFLGSAFALENTQFGLIAGGVLVFLFLICTGLRGYQKLPLIYFFLLFLLLTAFANAFARFELGQEYAVGQPRYRVYSALFALSTLLLLTDIGTAKFKQLLVTIVTLCSAAFFILNVYQYSAKMLQYRDDLSVGVMLYKRAGIGLQYSPIKRARDILKNSEKDKIYTLPSNRITNFESRLLDALNTQSSRQVRHELDGVKAYNKYFAIHGWVADSQKKFFSGRALIKLSTKEWDYWFDSLPMRRADVNQRFQRFPWSESGFYAMISKELLSPGTYNISLVLVSDAGVFEKRTKRSVTK